MKLSTNRILTTHVGSLPREQAVVEFLTQKENGQPYDPAAFNAAMRDGVAHVVAKQVEIGIDVVSDGENSKISYATYIKDRLSGFGGHTDRQISKDLQDYPAFREKMAVIAGKQTFQRQSCIGPIAVVDEEPLHQDIANLRAAVASSKPVEAFMNAASPGVVAAFQTNRYYPSHERYVEAIAEAMRPEYEAIVAAGFVLQIDCPDLAMARHTGFQDLSEQDFIARAAFHVEALNHALRNVPREQVRMHVCWGNYEGPHDHDIPLERIIDIIVRAKPAGILFEASNPRHAHEYEIWKSKRVPEDKLLIPGVITSTSNYVDHPEWVAQRLVELANVVGRERVIAGTDCGFGTFAGIGKVDAGIAYKKLRALVEGAALASKRLWG